MPSVPETERNRSMHKKWNKYFMEIAELVATRSTCLRRSVGAVIVKNKHILATGYNGTPSKVSHCSETGCLREKLNVPSGERHELCRGVHAEQNAIIQAAKHGVNIDNAEIYVTCSPCSICLKMLINAGIRTVYCKENYPDSLVQDLYKECDTIRYVELKDLK